MMCGESPAFSQPAHLPRQSSPHGAHHFQMNTLVEVLAMDATSKPASRIDTATYLATEPKPGQQSVMGKSLSTVFGTWTAWIG